MTAVELRPVVPDLGDLRIVPDPRPRIERSALVVDRSAGTAVWHSDDRTPRRVELRLGRGRGELATLTRAVYPPFMPHGFDTRLSGRLLLLDGTGRVLARSLLLPQELFDQAWPRTLLEQSGLPVSEERFRNTRVAESAHAGTAPLWPLTAGYGWFLLTVGSAVAAVIALLVLVLALTG